VCPSRILEATYPKDFDYAAIFNTKNHQSEHRNDEVNGDKWDDET